MAVKKEVFLVLITIILLSVAVSANDDIKQNLLSPETYFFESTDEYCRLTLIFDDFGM